MYYCPYINGYRDVSTNNEHYGEKKIRDMLNADNISIRMHSTGAYVGKYTVTYTYENKTYSQTETLTAGTTKSIQIPMTSTNVMVKAEAAVFFGIWNDIFVKNLGSPRTDVCFNIGGTTFYTNWEQISC